MFPAQTSYSKKNAAQEVRWSDCWGNAVIGDGVATGELHGALHGGYLVGRLNDVAGDISHINMIYNMMLIEI